MFKKQILKMGMDWDKQKNGISFDYVHTEFKIEFLIIDIMNYLLIIHVLARDIRA